MAPLPKQTAPRSAGFTLLEVMVALAILGVGLVTVIQLYSGTLRTVEMAEYYTKAVHLAKLKLSEAELAPGVTEGKWNGEFEPDDLLKSASTLDLTEFPLYRWELRVEPYDPPEELIPKPGEGEPQPVMENPIRMYRLISVVSWGTENRSHNLELSTLRTTFELPEEKKG
jgi:general secretion pathway protein I